VDGMPTVNGVVKPADSVNFPNDPRLQNVDFYRWSEQMFLWLTSPARNKIDHKNGIVLNSPAFYRVSAADESGRRYFIPNGDGKQRLLALRAAKPGPNGLPVVVDKAGGLLEVELPERARDGRPLVKSGEQKVEVSEIKLTDGEPPFEFLDPNGKRIHNPTPIFGWVPGGSNLIQPFRFGKITVYLDASGHEAQIGQGTTNAVLLSQCSALVYYMTSVNDVYAYFLTATTGGGTPTAPTPFPTTQAQLNKISDFAQAHGKALAFPNALCLQVKTSWIEADRLPCGSRESYITMKATIPTYHAHDPAHWDPSGTRCTDLALLGMHIAGSVKGHPEMVWATFEHFGNAPNAAYRYNAIGGRTKTVCQDTAGTWLFCRSGASSHFNIGTQKAFPLDGEIKIRAFKPHIIGPTDTLRVSPFGASFDERPNPNVTDAAASNTQIISMNNSVRGQLAPGDLRTHYYMLGATWTDGKAPDDSSPGGNIMGTSHLANTTMETFFAQPTNCFSCHKTSDPDRLTNMSHVFSALQPLRLR
jgi:hypothetical protein